MIISDYLLSKGYTHLESFHASGTENQILSDVYIKDSTLVIIDTDNICEIPFEYKRYCQKQNEWMRQFHKVYRFLNDDPAMASLFLENTEIDFPGSRTFNREDLIIDPTPLEYYFENCFEEAFGPDSFKYLQREFSFMLKDGNTAYIDYALFNKNGTWIAIEENGISWHHPFIIKKEKYRKILFKQNSVIDQDGIVFRWDTESMGNMERIADELKEFLGNISQYKIQSSLLAGRQFKFYTHQENHLSSLVEDRKEGYSSSLVVLPTGTGKTVIAIEDMINYYKEKGSINALIQVPSIDLRDQWLNIINADPLLKDKVSVITYALACRNYRDEPSDKYDYIVIDEAHHATAPVLKKMIRHYSPGFLLGLTATDKRLDEEKLEDVFGEYEIEIDLKTAIEKGILSQIRCFRLETNIDLSNVRFNGKDYYAGELERTIKVPSRNEIIADTIKEYFVDKLAGKSGIIFCVSVAHAKEMAGLLKSKGISAQSVDGQDKERKDKIEKYMEKKIQFLCTCSLLNEGWDAPHTSVIVMARPTMSKVLYTQQLGRGTRKYPGKEALYVIDVVDNYGAFGGYTNRPWSLHSLFSLESYKKFGNLFENAQTANKELTTLDTIYETAVKLNPFDLFTMEMEYGDYLSIEQMSRELFVSYGTVKSWLNNRLINADVQIPMGRGSIILFKPERVEEIRKIKKLKAHSEETITQDFWEFIELGDYTYSYKMFFILSLLDSVDSTGDAEVNQVLEKYISYYLERFDKNQIIDRANCPYLSREYVLNRDLMKKSMLENPFEKFERKRFMYHAKDLAKITIHHRIWDDLVKNNGIEKLKQKMYADIEKYYASLTGINNT